MSVESRVLVTARYVVPIPGQVLEKHYLVIENGRIVGVERFRDIDSSHVTGIHDLGNAVIVPGLINAATQLDTCHLHRRVPWTGSFTGWLESMVAARKTATPDQVTAGVRQGLQQAAEGGTTAIGDVSFTDASYAHVRRMGLRGVIYLEVFGFDPALAPTMVDRLQSRVEAMMEHEVATDGPVGEHEDPRPLLRFGVSPHAPYTVSQTLYRETLRLMVERGDRFCTRLGETPAERELLQVCEGEFIPFLEGMFPEGLPEVPAAASPVAYIADMLGQVRPEVPKDHTARFLVMRPPVLVHCADLDTDDLQLVAKMRSPVVFCPRHHEFFERDRHPVTDLLGRGQTVAVGTESLATNDTLSMLDELRYLARSEYGITPPQVLRMGTLYGARALGIEDETGVIAQGMQADLTAVELAPGTRPDRVLDAMLLGDGPVVFTMVNGRVVYKRDDD